MFTQDFRYAARMLRKNPGFTITAVLSLALGIGANTAIFSLIDALLLRMLPVRDPQQLVQITLTVAGQRTDSFSYPAVRALQEQADVFSSLCGFSPAVINAGTRDSRQRRKNHTDAGFSSAKVRQHSPPNAPATASPQRGLA
jgi:putative ABC transport system permease protein